jgi:hypothetical protein
VVVVMMIERASVGEAGLGWERIRIRGGMRVVVVMGLCGTRRRRKGVMGVVRMLVLLLVMGMVVLLLLVVARGLVVGFVLVVAPI